MKRKKVSNIKHINSPKENFMSFTRKVKKVTKKCKFVVYKDFKEKHYEAQLYQFLASRFGYNKIKYQKRTKEGIVDLAITDGNMHVEIEIKMHRGSSSLDRLVGQVLKYRKEYYRKKNRYLFTLILTRKDIEDIEKTSAFKEISKLRNVEVLIRKL